MPQALCSETSYWQMLSDQVLTGNCSLVVCVMSCVVCHTVLCGDLYTACVDASRTVFWDHSGAKPLIDFNAFELYTIY